MSSEDLASRNKPEFDNYADDYDATLTRGLRLTGESKDYFSRNRICLLAAKLHNLNAKPRTLLDFGCGTGSATPLFREHLNVSEITGIDPSEKSLDEARKAHGNKTTRFINSNLFTR